MDSHGFHPYREALHWQGLASVYRQLSQGLAGPSDILRAARLYLTAF